MTTEVTTPVDGPAQVGTLTAADVAEAAKQGISIAPVPSKEGEAVVVDPDALPSDADAPVEEKIEADPDRPAWLPEKFKTVEEMAAAYKELETKQGEPKAPVKENDGTKPPETETGKQAADIVTKAGLDWAKLSTEWTEGKGSLSEASYKAFEAVGVNKDLVNGFINGQNAIAAASANVVRDAAFGEAGGEAKYMEAVTWAATNLDAATIASFDKTITGNDAAAVKMAVAGLMSAYTKAGGAEPVNLGGSGGKGLGGTYANVDQMVKDMSDPRYSTDAAFRKRVEAKAGRSNF